MMTTAMTTIMKTTMMVNTKFMRRLMGTNLLRGRNAKHRHQEVSVSAGEARLQRVRDNRLSP